VAIKLFSKAVRSIGKIRNQWILYELFPILASENEEMSLK